MSGAAHPGHGHEHDSHGHDHGHDHDHPAGPLARVRALFHGHSHDPADSVDQALEASSRGMRALGVSLAGLGVTAAVQAAVFVLSGSAALLADTLHNFADALTAVPLSIAFLVGRRPANRRYTYGYGRAEDLAGLAVLAVIAASSVAAAWESVRHLVGSTSASYPLATAVAGVVGFAGNEVVARYRIRVGRQIGSAALVADGMHARTDGITSLGVVVGAIGVWQGVPVLDPVMGLVITAAILFVLRDAAREVYRRLMDAVDPALVDRVEAVLRGTPGVLDVGTTRLRWIGHQLRAECEVVVDGALTVVDGHRVAEECQHALLHELPRLSAALVHADPDTGDGESHHELSAHHERRAGS